MKVFLAGTSLAPAYGGPARSVSRLAAALGEAGARVGLWAPDQSASTTPFLASGAAIERLKGTAADALDGFGRPDVLHDNGMWLPHNHGLARLAASRGIPRVVSTRGMLEPWALQHKWLKKRIAWWLYQRRDLQRARIHHATSDAEAENLKGLELDVPVCAIPNGVDISDVEPAVSRPPSGGSAGAAMTALFVGRIYPVKGLLMLVEAWHRVRPSDWRLQIAGPDEAGHRRDVERAVSAAGLDERISFLGPLDDQAKRAALLDADLFVLPSRSESFGVAIGEALAHGVPVLTTTAAPWPMLVGRGCGWRVEPTVDGIADGLDRATMLDSIALRAMGAKGRALVAAEFGWDAVARQFVDVYRRLVA